MALSDLDETARFTAALRELGCAVAIDDFGAGYTSFRNLKMLSVDILKLDGSFCEELSANEDNQYFVRSLIDLAQKFELKTIAEWVRDGRRRQSCASRGASTICRATLFGEASLELPWPDGEATRRPRSRAGESARSPRRTLSLEHHCAAGGDAEVGR